MADTQPFYLTLRFNAPPGEAANRAEAIADLCAAEFGTSDPRLTPADATRWGVRRIDDDHIRLFVNGLLFDFDPSGAVELAETIRVILTPADGDRERTPFDDFDLREMVGARLEAAQVRDADGVAALVSDVVSPMLERLRAELAEARDVTIPFLGSQVERFREEIADLNRALVKEMGRVQQAETERDTLRETLAESDLGALTLAQWEAIAAADADRDRLEAAIERARAEHARDDSNPRGPWCPTCLTKWPCPTIAALDASSAPESARPVCKCPPGCGCHHKGATPPRMRPVSVESPGNDGFRYERENQEDADV